MFRPPPGGSGPSPTRAKGAQIFSRFRDGIDPDSHAHRANSPGLVEELSPQAWPAARL